MSKRSANTPPDPQPRRRLMLRVGAIWAGVSLAAVVWSLWGMTLDRSGGAEAAAHNARMLWPYWIASASCWLGLTIVWIALRRQVSHWPKQGAWIVLGVAILARLVVLVTHNPALSDDVYRYIFDGRNVAHGFNPYLTDPTDRRRALADGGGAENWAGERGLLPLLAYPEVTTPYLPFSQYVFAAMGVVCEAGGWTSPEASARVFRTGLVVIELLLMLLLLRVLRKREWSPWWLALYAWHPLAIDGFAASGHQDVIGIALMVAALAIGWANAERGRGAWHSIMFAALSAGAVMVKPIAALAGLMAVRHMPLRAWIVSLIVGSIACIALALPLNWYPQQREFAAWKRTADWMAEKAAHFGGVYEPVLCVVRHQMSDGPDRQPGFNLEQEWLARKICMWALAATLLAIFILARDAWRATAAAMLAVTLCSTTCHPWYLLWGLALVPIGNRSWGLWVYGLTISFGYAVFFTGKGHALGVEWTVAPEALAIAYIPVAIGLCVDACAMARRRRASPHVAELVTNETE